MIPRMRKRSQAGFSAVELMIALTIGILISGVVVAVFTTSATTYRVSNSVAELQETGRVAVAAIERDSRMAGYRGCNSNNVNNSGPFVNSILVPAAYNNNLGAYVRGYNYTSPGTWTPALDDVPFNIVDGSDVLMLRVPSGPAIAVTAVMANGTADLTVASTAGLAVGDRMIVADCAQASGFRISAVNAGSLSHAAGLNATSDFGRAFGNDAIAMRYIAREYYIGASSSGVAGETSLWVKDGPDVPVELAENVERFEVLYGEDLNNDFVADVFRNADQVANFTNVVAVQVHLLTRGNRVNETMTATPYNFLGTTTIPVDRRIRRVYAATIQLRNRVL